MPTNQGNVQAELNSMKVLNTIYPDPDPDPWDPYNCPTCRSGVIEYPVAIMADVVTVEL